MEPFMGIWALPGMAREFPFTRFGQRTLTHEVSADSPFPHFLHGDDSYRFQSYAFRKAYMYFPLQMTRGTQSLNRMSSRVPTLPTARGYGNSVKSASGESPTRLEWRRKQK